jgi:hypothetical protein
MKTAADWSSFAEQLTRLDKRVTAALASYRSFSPCFLYHDGRTRKWAREIYDRMLKLAGEQRLRATWWKIDELSMSGVLAGAVSTALRADALVLATDASEGMPLPFYVWVKAWLPHRLQAGGTLVALLGKPAQPGPWSGRLTRFLRSVAKQARMEFLKDERPLPVVPATTESVKRFLPAQSRTAGHRHNSLGFPRTQSGEDASRFLTALGNPLLRPPNARR